MSALTNSMSASPAIAHSAVHIPSPSPAGRGLKGGCVNSREAALLHGFLP